MLHMGNFNLQHLLQIHSAAFAVDSASGQGFGFQAVNDLRELAAVSVR